ncbi:MAG: prolipoprotein diacylglyceryl transferase, partial [Paludibacteraceae bacterium]|nr:prolipoprotein diacylglyceryl transferase [Paludibacteraceae bacterium]
MLNYIIWNVSPEAFAIGNFAVRWYGLLWALGFLVGYKIVEKEFKHENLNLEWLDSLFMYIFLGSVIGARIGHCLFYEWSYYSAHPLEILYVWKGGLASHGGAIGLLIALYIYNKRISKKGYVWLFDHIVIAVAFAGFCIRLGNLMNSEIYGTPTD